MNECTPQVVGFYPGITVAEYAARELLCKVTHATWADAGLFAWCVFLALCAATLVAYTSRKETP